jgi:septal ring factor EnvC (AmiA/AmiB activator)
MRNKDVIKILAFEVECLRRDLDHVNGSLSTEHQISTRVEGALNKAELKIKELTSRQIELERDLKKNCQQYKELHAEHIKLEKEYEQSLARAKK